LFASTIADFTKTKLYGIQHPLVQGVTASQSITNSPSAFISGDVILHLNTSDPNRKLVRYMASKNRFSNGYLRFGSIINNPGMDVWSGKVFITPDPHPQEEFAFALGNVFDGATANSYFTTNFFTNEGGKLGHNLVAPPSPDIFFAAPGQTLVYGRGAIFPQAWSDAFNMHYYGQQEEIRMDDYQKSTYELYNASGTLLSSGLQPQLTAAIIPKAPVKIIYRNNNYKVNNLPGIGTLTTVRGYVGSYWLRCPNITSLQIRNHLDVPSEMIENGAGNSIRFSFDDQQLVQSSVKLFLKGNGQSTWVEVPYTSVGQTAFNLPDPAGSLYKADLCQLPFPVGAVDLKLSASDTEGNSTEWVLQPAFVLQNNNQSPTIIAQNAITMPMNKSRTIAFTDLIVQDPDNTYPNGFTLSAFPGANYSLSGNTLTPATDFYGDITVPVQVSDGLEKSDNCNLFNLKITVGTPLQIDSLALVKLYNTAGGSGWTNKTNWLTGRLSTWYGVTVAGNRVSSVSLNNNNLVGTADITFGLDQCTTFIVGLNKLTRVDMTNLQSVVLCHFNKNPITTVITNPAPNFYSKLEHHNIGNCYLAGADISNMPAMVGFTCSGIYGGTTTTPNTSFVQLVTNTTANYYSKLEYLNVNYTGLTTINTSGMPVLWSIYGNDSKYTNLDLSKNPLLKQLELSNNNMVTLDISKNPLLEWVRCSNNKISSFVTNETANYYPNLGELRLLQNDMNRVYIANMPNLTFVQIGYKSGPVTGENTNLTQVVTNSTPNYYPKLATLYVYLTAVTSLDLRGMSQLQYFYGYMNHLTTLNIAGLTKLKVMQIYNNNLTSLDISQCAELTNLWAYNNQISTFIKNSTAGYYAVLEDLLMEKNNLTGIDIANMPKLKQLRAGTKAGTTNGVNTSFTTVTTNASPNYYSSLLNVNLSYTALSQFNVSNMPVLRSLDLRFCKFTTINLGNATALQGVSLQDNQLTFDQLEPLVGKYSTFGYAPQNPIVNSPYTTNVLPGGTINFTVTTGGVNNRYQWQKWNGTSWSNIGSLTTTPSYVKNNAVATDAGLYRCAITNTTLSGLTLYRSQITLTVNSGGRVDVSEHDSGIGQNKDEYISVYPVPANDELLVKVIKENGGIKANLFSLSGLSLQEAESPFHEVVLNVRNLAPGIYLLKIRTADGIVTRKVSIQH
jgi:hypothetical protein